MMRPRRWGIVLALALVSAALAARLWVTSSGRETSGLAALDVILLSIVPGILVVLGVLLWYGWRVSASLPEFASSLSGRGCGAVQSRPS